MIDSSAAAPPRMRTRATDLLGIRYPIVQGGMQWVGRVLRKSLPRFVRLRVGQHNTNMTKLLTYWYDIEYRHGQGYLECQSH